MSTVLRTVALAAAGVLLATLAPPAVTASAPAAVPVTKIRPPRLAEGPAPAFAHVEGTTVVDGTVRLPVDAAQVILLGESGEAYVVIVVDGDGRRVVRLAADGTQRTLIANARSLNVTLSGDGEDLVAIRLRSSEKSDVRVYDSSDGATVATRRFPGSVTALDADEQRVVLGSWGPGRAFWWHTRTDRTKKISEQVGASASIAANRISTYTRDPYDGGCTVVRNLRHPGRVLWRSCSERVEAFAPDGRSMATVAILSDGIGPGDVVVRKDRGRKLAHYSTWWFGLVRWESSTALVLDANGRTKHALVRCVRAVCERVGPLAPTPDL